MLFACSNAHFLKEEDYRNQVTKDFEQKKQALPHGDLFTVLSNPDLSVYEQEALMFLYAYMPIGDVTDYSGDYYFGYPVRHVPRCLGEIRSRTNCSGILCYLFG